MPYINTIDNYSRETETIDEGTWKECKEWIKEYRLAFKSSNLWISQRSTKDWRNKC